MNVVRSVEDLVIHSKNVLQQNFFVFFVEVLTTKVHSEHIQTTHIKVLREYKSESEEELKNNLIDFEANQSLEESDMSELEDFDLEDEVSVAKKLFISTLRLTENHDL